MKTDPILDKCFYIVGWVLIAIALIAAIAVRSGMLNRFGGLPPCAFYALTGLYCPGCGGTRAVIALFHGKIIASLYYHPFVFYTAAAGGWFMVSQTIERVFRGKIRIGMHYRDIYLWIALAIILLNCIAKNLLLVLGGFAMD